MKTIPKNIQTVLDILKDEVSGDITSAREKMTKDYTMTWIYQTKKGELFPRTYVTADSDLEDAYPIKGRVYKILNIAEEKNTVFVELIESYPDPETGEIYRTPLVLVLEFKDGKIRTGRHYCDPTISYLHLSEDESLKAFVETDVKYVISA